MFSLRQILVKYAKSIIVECMAFLEPGNFCRAEEYHQGFMTRVNESEIKEGDLYTLLARFEQDIDRAAKLPVRSLDIKHKSGIAVVRFAFVSSDLKPVIETEETMKQGIINDLNGAVVIDPITRTSLAIKEAYFRDYFEDQFGKYLAESQLRPLAVSC